MTGTSLQTYYCYIVFVTNKPGEGDVDLATSAALRQINQARILNTLRRGSWSRVALAEELGLNRSTVTVIISTLIEQSLVRKLDTRPTTASDRPLVDVALRGDEAYFGGLEFGNDQLTAAVSDLTDREIDRATEPTEPNRNPNFAEKRLIDLMSDIVSDRMLESVSLTIPNVISTKDQLK